MGKTKLYQVKGNENDFYIPLETTSNEEPMVVKLTTDGATIHINRCGFEEPLEEVLTEVPEETLEMYKIVIRTKFINIWGFDLINLGGVLHELLNNL